MQCCFCREQAYRFFFRFANLWSQLAASTKKKNRIADINGAGWMLLRFREPHVSRWQIAMLAVRLSSIVYWPPQAYVMWPCVSFDIRHANIERIMFPHEYTMNTLKLVSNNTFLNYYFQMLSACVVAPMPPSNIILCILYTLLHFRWCQYEYVVNDAVCGIILNMVMVTVQPSTPRLTHQFVTTLG